MEDAVASIIGYPLTYVLEIIGLLVGTLVGCAILGYICLVVDWINSKSSGVSEVSVTDKPHSGVPMSVRRVPT